MYEVLEREGKWDVDAEFQLPDLHGIIADADVVHDTVDLTSDYYDTADRDLLAHRVQLRRRTGDDDTGWQLKVPTGDGRIELHWASAETLPDDAAELLSGMSLGKQLASVATIHTIRKRYRLAEPRSGELYAEIADDSVRAWADERLLAWREVEVELGTHAPSIPKRLVRRLTAAGARPSRFPSKLAHVLPPVPSVQPASSGARALLRYVNAQIDEIMLGDIELRRGRDPIHDTRVAIRRLRSTLRVFGKMLDRSATDHLDEELRWFAGLLGEVRDCQVQQRRFTEALDELPEELILGPVRARVRTDLQAVELPARVRITEAMDSPRYLAIMAVLRSWRTAPPVDPEASTAKLVKRARKAQRKADRRLVAALDVDDSDPALLHRARKAAKRARYAAELCRDVGAAKQTKRTVKHYKQFQSILGDHQDTVVAARLLRRLALASGTTAGENGFTFGLLYGREQRIADECRRQARELL
ncbi:CYTH and CHAD domain-containing protein [Mycolicibacterium sp. CBMA 226]|uniref:CYTH and CHAD domain-containing protein n=1 Tax=Mycolicibacterium sp. CBMA 226 TaxID=2606611 RepID=UPI0012DD1DC2|nr:CYTH and CHAD domain-containing protein [Mycolicibacterium sp. CBMA 226]MUL78107.1 CYTH and CHAD domain-containing protein [Mycolicibacterium sp. CBMA 226]